MRKFKIKCPAGIKEVKVGAGQKSQTFPVKNGIANIQVDAGPDFSVASEVHRNSFHTNGKPVMNRNRTPLHNGPFVILDVDSDVTGDPQVSDITSPTGKESDLTGNEGTDDTKGSKTDDTASSDKTDKTPSTGKADSVDKSSKSSSGGAQTRRQKPPRNTKGDKSDDSAKGADDAKTADSDKKDGESK